MTAIRYGGRRPDHESTEVPTLHRYDWDRQARWFRDIPRRCPAAHRTALFVELPEWKHPGRVFCNVCGRNYAWLTPAEEWRL